MPKYALKWMERVGTVGARIQVHMFFSCGNLGTYLYTVVL